MNVLITCGPTWVAIDQVRVLSNVSTGEMGHAIADAFVKQGAAVTLLEGPVTHVWKNSRVKIIKYRFFNELSEGFKKLLKKRFDVVIHAAAVSDFNVLNVSRVKNDSSLPVTLKLIPTPKLIEMIKRIAPEAFVVGFKLESTLKQAVIKAKNQLKNVNSDLVVANSSGKKYEVCLVNRHGKVVFKTPHKHVLAEQLAQLVTYHLKFIQ